MKSSSLLGLPKLSCESDIPPHVNVAAADSVLATIEFSPRNIQNALKYFSPALIVEKKRPVFFYRLFSRRDWNLQMPSRFFPLFLSISLSLQRLPDVLGYCSEWLIPAAASHSFLFLPASHLYNPRQMLRLSL